MDRGTADKLAVDNGKALTLRDERGGEVGSMELLTSDGDVRFKVPRAQGYIVVDSQKCSGCQSCMMACSLVHEGEVSLSLSRIQVMQNIMQSFPHDLKVVQCRQCVFPTCLVACPKGATHIDAANGNTRVVDEEKCNGCKLCIEFCPYLPHRTIWHHLKKKVIKCDLCAQAPHWRQKGGVNGKQACVEVCPLGAIKFVTKAPKQMDDVGYDVDLRTGAEPGRRPTR